MWFSVSNSAKHLNPRSLILSVGLTICLPTAAHDSLPAWRSISCTENYFWVLNLIKHLVCFSVTFSLRNEHLLRTIHLTLKVSLSSCTLGLLGCKNGNLIIAVLAHNCVIIPQWLFFPNRYFIYFTYLQVTITYRLLRYKFILAWCQCFRWRRAIQ